MQDGLLEAQGYAVTIDTKESIILPLPAIFGLLTLVASLIAACTLSPTLALDSAGTNIYLNIISCIGSFRIFAFCFCEACGQLELTANRHTSLERSGVVDSESIENIKNKEVPACLNNIEVSSSYE